MKIVYNMIHPIEFIEKIRWRIAKKKLKFCGDTSSMGMYFSLRGLECISIGEDSHCGKFNQFSAYLQYRGKNTGIVPVLVIGNNVSIMNNCQISCANNVEVDDGTLLGDNVFIADNFHGANRLSELVIPPIDRDLFIGKPIYIGKNVWIGRNVCIMPGVKIGDGAIIGANAVVTKDIPRNCVAVGVPAKVIREIKS